MARKSFAVKRRLIEEVQDIIQNHPGYVIERDGFKWAAIRTHVWLETLGVPERTFRSWISKPPFVRRVYCPTEEDRHRCDYSYERVLCLRIGEDRPSAYDRSKELARTYYRKQPKKPKGYEGWLPSWMPKVGTDGDTSWKAVDRQDAYHSFMKLADLWGDRAPEVFEFVWDHWSDFMVDAKVEGFQPDRKLSYPTLAVVLRYERVAFELWSAHERAKSCTRNILH